MQSSKKPTLPSDQWLVNAVASCLRERFEGHPGEWADGRLQIPYSTQAPIFIMEVAPWLIPAFEAIGRRNEQGLPYYRKIDIRGPAGSGKSLIGEIDICFTVENDPGLYYYVWPGDQDGKDQVEDRIMPIFIGNSFLASLLPVDRHKKRISKIVFPDMSFYSLGAGEGNAHRVRAYRLTMEEPHLYKPGMMAKFRDRMTGVTGSRELTLSTGSVIDHETDKEFNKGTCHKFMQPCPACGHFQFLESVGADDKCKIEWDKNDQTLDENGEYRWDALKASMRLHCENPECLKPLPTGKKERHDMALKGRAVQTNPNAPSDHFSYHYTSAAVDWIAIADIGEKYLTARHALRIGNMIPYQNFIQKDEAKAWDESPPKAAAEIQNRFGGYVKRTAWPDEISRFLTVDNQHGRSSIGEMPHRWCLARGWGESESHLIEECKVDEWEDVEALRKSLNIAPARVLVDIAFDRTDVLKACFEYGWQGLIGEDKRISYPHKGKDEKGNPAIFQLPYSPPKRGHVGIGERGRVASATYFHWCHKDIKELYHRLAGGLAEDYQFSIADDASEDYVKQVGVEYKRLIKGQWVYYRPNHKPDHLLDCELENLAAAAMDPRLPIGKSLRKRSTLHRVEEETE